ncbi:hypothetical protein KM043_011633 [Ampulex compressa]|nr:hypothetical protein KM043_011633 [Ampulex compressa]
MREQGYVDKYDEGETRGKWDEERSKEAAEAEADGVASRGVGRREENGERVTPLVQGASPYAWPIWGPRRGLLTSSSQK